MAFAARPIVSHFRRDAALALFLVASLGGCGGKAVSVLETEDRSAPPGASASGSVAAGNTPISTGTTVSTGAAASGAFTGSTADAYTGPFKILVLSKTLGFHHDSIPACQQMVRELGRCIDATSCATTGDAVVAGAKPNSAFTVDVAGAPAGCMELPSATLATTTSQYQAYTSMGCDGSSTTDLSQFSSANLDTNQFTSLAAPKGPYQMIFFCSPTGTVFTSGGPNGMAGMIAIQNFIEAGGAYGGVHAVPDLDDTQPWQWYYDDLMGAWLMGEAADGTSGTVNTTMIGVTHPVMRGIPNPWNAQDEWWGLNREISALPGFETLATLTLSVGLDGSPVVWVKPFPVMSDPTHTFEGRMFYTIRGHNIARYGETAFRQLVHQGILWAAHRLD
jgi:trehalose utilization protein